MSGAFQGHVWRDWTLETPGAGKQEWHPQVLLAQLEPLHCPTWLFSGPCPLCHRTEVMQFIKLCTSLIKEFCYTSPCIFHTATWSKQKYFFIADFSWFFIALGGSICSRGVPFSDRRFSFFLNFNHIFLALTPIQRSKWQSTSFQEVSLMSPPEKKVCFQW